MARDRIALRATGDREKLLDQAKAAIGADADAHLDGYRPDYALSTGADWLTIRGL